MTMKKLLGISLALVMLCGSVPLGYSEPLRVQLEQGIETNQILCDNPDHVLVLRTNGNMACVSEKTADKTGWLIMDMNFDWNEFLIENPVEWSDESLDDIIFGTTTVMASNEGNTAAIGNLCSSFPKNLTIEYPNAVTVNQEFDVTVSYTNIVWDDEDVAESELTGVPLAVEDAEYRLEEARSGCYDTLISMTRSDKLSTLNENMVIDESVTNSKTGKIKNTSIEEFPFNNTEPQTQTLTLRYDELPDRYDASTMIGTNGNKVFIYHYVENDTIYLLATYPLSSENTNTASITVDGTSLQSIFTPLEIETSDYFTEEIVMPQETRPLCEIIICDDNYVSSLPPMEGFAEFLAATVEPEDLVAWLENEEKLTPEYIKELLETYFPDVTAQFLLFFNFDIPYAFADPTDLVYIYGNTGYNEGTNVNDPNIPFNEVTICAYDRNEITGEDELLYYGDAVCDVTDENGAFALYAYKDDPNDSDFFDLVLYVFPKNEYFEFVQYIRPNDSEDEEAISKSFEFLTLIDSDNFEEIQFFMFDDDSHFLHSIEVLELMTESKDFIISEYNYEASKVIVNYEFDNCDTTFYEPYDYAPDKVIFLEDDRDFVNCNSHEMYESDTPKHEYYHFYTDEIYTVKNNGELPDDTNWGTHRPDINIPEDQAWFEGIATAFVLMEKDGLSVGDPYIYKSVLNLYPFDYEDGFGISSTDGSTVYFAEGITSEGAVTTFIYDLIDNTSSETGDEADKVDNINLSATEVNNVFDDTLSGSETIVAFDVLDFVADWEDEGYPDINNVLFLNTIIDGISTEIGIILKENWEISLPSTATYETISDSFIVTLNIFDTLVFDYTISSEANYDDGRIYIDDVLIFETSGESVDTFTYTVTSSGSKTVKIEYYKDGSVSEGDDLFRIDTLTHYSSDETIGVLIFEDDFNTDLSNWTLSGDTDWEIGQYSFDQPPFADNVMYNVATIDNCDDFCIMEIARDLGDYDELYLNFWYFVDEDVDDEEGLKVEISLNSGNTWDEILYWYEDNGNSHTWEELRNYDISEYAGSSFNLRFTAISSSSTEDMMLANFALRGILGDTGGGGGNNAPTIFITSPSISSEFDEGDSITFTASANDDNDSNIDSNISWSSNHDGVLGTGSSINTSSLSVNTHVITASVTDSGGLSASDTIAIDVIAVDDFDGDGIYNVIDSEPNVYSNDFTDSTTFGSIVTRGDQTITIQDHDTLGVIIDVTAGTLDAEVDACGNTTLLLSADDSLSVTCGSSSVIVYQGPVDVIFYGDSGEEASATLIIDDEIYFDPIYFSFTNSGNNSVTVTYNSQEFVVANDQVPVYPSTDSYAEVNFIDSFDGSDGGTQFTATFQIAVDSIYRMIVSDVDTDLVQIFTPSGTFISDFDGSDGGTAFTSLVGLAVDSTDRIYVLDIDLDLVQIFDPTGVFISSFDGSDGGTQFVQPISMKIDSNDRIIVSDDYNDTIQIFDPTGVFISSFDGTDGGTKFDFSVGLAVDSNDRIFVVDPLLTLVQIFDSNGVFIDSLDGSDGGTQFILPYSIVIDSNDRMIVGDLGINFVQIFTPSGTFITSFDGTDGGVLFDTQLTMAVDSTDRIIVGSVSSSSVQIFVII